MIKPSEAATAYAHSIKGRPVADWERLPVHLCEVGNETAMRADKFGCASLGMVLGQLHDFGKFKTAFQDYLHDPTVLGKGHSTAGAVYAIRHLGIVGKIIAHAVASHHAGLKDNLLARDGRLESAAGELDLALAGFASASSGFTLPDPPVPPTGFEPDGPGPSLSGFQFAFLIRMLFSCLVDADRFCTARFYAPFDGQVVEHGPKATIDQLSAKLTAWMDAKAQEREENGEATRSVNQRRAEILASVRSHVTDPRRVFTLTVPTGGGKTLTGLDFALRYADEHELDRVIVVIPFTSVIEQTAGVYRTALGELAGEVLEHHSAFDEEKLRGEDRQGYDKLQLAMEDWDARIVVTTAVQFFESLFSNRPSQCRKLHNLAKSIVVIDEAQTIPLTLLRPCVAALKEFVRNYGVTVVLSTATQPALIERSDDPERSFAGGFASAEVVELAPDPPKLFELMKRVTVELIGEQDDSELATRMAANQALCIVNTRRHARELYRMSEGQPGARHLSTMMHPAHRSRVLAEIKDDLKPENNKSCRVVSTSLIEAGVDVDFPLVLRAETGLDQLAQSAGRLNREDRRGVAESLLLVFRAVGQWVPKELATNVQAGQAMLRRYGQACLNPEAIEAYFFDLYRQRGRAELDRPGVLNLLHDKGPTLDFPFETIARDVRLIDQIMRPIIIVNDDESRRWLAELEDRDSKEPLRTIARKLQRYTVGLTNRDYDSLQKARVTEAIREETFGDQFVKLTNMSLYRSDVGLDCSDPYFMDAGKLVV